MKAKWKPIAEYKFPKTYPWDYYGEDLLLTDGVEIFIGHALYKNNEETGDVIGIENWTRHGVYIIHPTHYMRLPKLP